MEEHKTQPVETSAVADPIRERAETPNYDLHKQSSVETDRPGSHDPSHRLAQHWHTQLQFGPHLADGYAPSSTRMPDHPSRRLVQKSRSDGDKKLVKPCPNANPEIERELAEVKAAWQKYRSTNRRDAVYFYLEAVFAVVTRWQRLKCSLKNSQMALRLHPNAPRMKPETFAIVIFCTSDPAVANAKTRSKWSRVLRYARKAKPINQRLAEFIKSNGGLNECARRFARKGK